MKLKARLLSSLFLCSVALMAAGPILVSTLNRSIDQKFQTLALVEPLDETDTVLPACRPIITADDMQLVVNLDTSLGTDPEILLRMSDLFLEDQALRLGIEREEPGDVEQADLYRRVEVLGYIRDRKLNSPKGLVWAAFIFQHGNCPDHYLFANKLAKAALDAGDEDARWIYAATLDRYLMSLNQPQKYGTQFTFVDGTYQLYQVDPATTDAERAAYNVPPLEQQLANPPEVSRNDVMRNGWLASWWLTLIGAGYAALGALIALVDRTRNASHGWWVVILALVALGISVWGHFLQVMAFQNGITDQKGWSVTAIIALVILIGNLAYLIVRLVQDKKLIDQQEGKSVEINL